MSLEAKLAAIRAESAKKFPPEVKEAFARATQELRDSGIADEALNVGDKAPAIDLGNTASEFVSSSKLLENGPLVVTFYRGVW